MKRVLALFAKAPVPGQVKTRLCPPLNLEQAASLYEAMLRDIIEQTAAVPDVERALWFTPDEARDWFERAAPGFRLHPQRGETLGERMAQLFRSHAREGGRRIVLRGTDSPTLPRQVIDDAFAALDEHDLVLCPDRDGGYNLIGLRGPADALFSLPMSTASVLDETLRRARALGHSVRVLAAHHDVDTAADLAALVPDARTPRTAAELAKLRGSMAP